MSDKKNKPFINMDFAQLYPHVVQSFNPIGFKRVFRMIAIKKIFNK